MRGIEDDRRPPGGRLHDLERRRQFAIKLGHRRAPFLKSALPKQLSASQLSASRFCRNNGCFYSCALSVITTILPSKKAVKKPQTSGKVPQMPKTPALIDLRRVPVQK
jgi:hypothetical protein